MYTSTFFNQPIRGPRAYKSRRERPCDFCRSRKVACQINVAPPCTFCYTQGYNCTFEASPPKRKRTVPNDNAWSGTAKQHANQTHGNRATQGDNRIPARPEHEFQGSSYQVPVEVTRNNTDDHSNGRDSSTSLSSPARSNEHSPRTPAQNTTRPISSLSSYDGLSVRVVGDACPMRHLRWNERDECSLSHVTYRRMYSEANADPITFMITEETIGRTGEPRGENDELAKASRMVEAMFSIGQAERLVKLFFVYVYPYFPVLSQTWFFTPDVSLASRVLSLPLSLRCALYATAVPFMLYDDHLSTTLAHSSPSRSQLYRIAWMAIQTELHAPNLSTLQACLLMLQRGPTNQYIAATPFKASLLGWTVNLVHSLGIHRDCSGWSLPAWERRVRIRLWWATFSMDVWTSIETGTPFLINTAECDVRPLKILKQASHSLDALELRKECVHFLHLTSLSRIVADLYTTFFTVQASASTSSDLFRSLELARTLRSRLSMWRQQYSADCPLTSSQTIPGDPNGNPALDLAYLVATARLFQALLRSLPYSADPEAANAVHSGALTCCREAAHFLETIVSYSNVWNAFWHSWSQSNFAVVSNYLAQVLMLQKEREGQSVELSSLVDRWRRAMRSGAGSGGWGHTLMSLSLHRLAELMTMDDIQNGDHS
jgi:hypothetical protein